MTTQTKTIWQRVKLSEIADVRDGTHDTPKRQPSGKPLITSKQLKNGVILPTDYFISERDFDFVNKRSKVDENDVLISMIGTVGETAFIKSKPDFAIKNIGLIKNHDFETGKFIFYWLNSPVGKEEVSKRLRGTSQGFLSLGSLRELEILLPDASTRKQIAGVLSDYDDLIENNMKRIKILEKIAQAIYKEWFVSSINDDKLPKGWKILKVEELVKRVSPGKLYDNKSALEKGRVPILDQGKSGIIGYHNDNPGVEAGIDNPIIAFANHTCYQRLILFPFSAIQNVLPFYPSEENYRNIFWLHYATKDVIEFNDYKGHWPEFMQKEIVVPLADLTEKFGSEIKPLVVLSYRLELENQNLREARALLLPKLVTGEIKV